MSNIKRKWSHQGRVHPQVALARSVYGVQHFNGHRAVASYENALGKLKVEGGEPNLSVEDRLTCPDCSRFKSDHDWQACGAQGKLF